MRKQLQHGLAARGAGLMLAAACALSTLASAAPAKLFATINPTTRNSTLSGETVLLADKDTSALPIVIAADAGKDATALAEELASTLKQITGATFTIKRGGNGPAIYLGTIAEFPTPSAAAGLKLIGEFDGREAFAIRVENGSIKLLGATSKGMPFAMTRFLENLGCRYFYASAAWTVVPKIPRLTYNRNESDRPELVARYFGYPLSNYFEKGDVGAGNALKTWWRRNYVGKGFSPDVGHAAHMLREKFKAEFDAHPEYNALITTPSGERQRKTGKWGQLCISNPRVQEMAAQYATEYFDKNPYADMVGIGPDDGGGWCTCEVCTKLWPDPNDAPFFLANVAAKAVRQKHPGKYVGIYAYNYHCDPPPFAMEPNVYVELTSALLLNTNYSFEELLELWPQKVSLVGVYDYWAVYDWIRDSVFSGRTADTNYVGQKLPAIIRSGIASLTSESGNSWGSQGLGYYLASRVLWNSSVDTNALKEEFYSKAFGPAAKDMKAYYTRLDKAGSPLSGPTLLRLAIDDLDRAEAAAKNDADVLERIKQLKQYHAFLYYHYRYNGTFFSTDNTPLSEEQKKQAAFEAAKWNYRIRNSYMTFWDFFVDQTTKKLATTFNEPTWNVYLTRREKGEIPFMLDKSEPSLEEANRVLSEAKKFYGEPVDLDAVQWSNDYVTPAWPMPKPITIHPVPSQGGRTILLEAKPGEPLRFTVAQSTIYKNIRRGKYTVYDKSGTLVASDHVEAGEHTIEVKVPQPGIYTLHYNDNAAGWSFTSTPGVRSGYLLDRKTGISSPSRGAFWIYVPKGTKEIRLFASRTHIFSYRTADGRKVSTTAGETDLRSTGRVLRLVVPEGGDGQLWSARDMHGSFYFLNIPNVMLTRDDGPIIPRELAEKDGLK